MGTDSLQKTKNFTLANPTYGDGFQKFKSQGLSGEGYLQIKYSLNLKRRVNHAIHFHNLPG
jgi:CxxC motif-containing protein (DUF1111 family)